MTTTNPTVSANAAVTTGQIIDNIVTGFIPSLVPTYTLYVSKISQIATSLYNTCTGTGDIYQAYCTALIPLLTQMQTASSANPTQAAFWNTMLQGITAESKIGLANVTPPTLIMPPLVLAVLQDLLAARNQSAFTRTYIPDFTPIVLGILYNIGLGLGPASNPVPAELLASRYSSIWQKTDVSRVQSAITTWVNTQAKTTTTPTQNTFVHGIINAVLPYFPNLSLLTIEYFAAYLLLLNVPYTNTAGANNTAQIVYSSSYTANTTTRSLYTLQVYGLEKMCMALLKLCVALTVSGDTLAEESIMAFSINSLINKGANLAKAASDSAKAAALSAISASNVSTAAAVIAANKASIAATVAAGSAKTAANYASITNLDGATAAAQVISTAATEATARATAAAASATAAAASAQQASDAAMTASLRTISLDDPVVSLSPGSTSNTASYSLQPSDYILTALAALSFIGMIVLWFR